jgi:Uma2 family endonuclease
VPGSDGLSVEAHALTELPPSRNDENDERATTIDERGRTRHSEHVPAAKTLRRLEGEYRDELLSSLTNGSSRSNEKEPASGPRRRKEVDLYGPYSDEPEMESYVHLIQNVLLLRGLQWAWRDRSDYFASANMSVFYAVMTAAGNKVTRKLKFRGPDFFVALDVRPEPRRRSWVVENEGKYPDVIVEVLSSRTKNADRGRKKEIYEQTFRTPEYFLFEPKTETLEGFRLVDGKYAAIAPNAHGHLWSEKLGMAFGLHHEPAVEGKVARYFTADGEMIAIPEEEVKEAQRAADKARAEAKEARTTAVRATARATRLAEKLRALGIDPDKLT